MLSLIFVFVEIIRFCGVIGQSQSGIAADGRTYLCLPDGTLCPTANTNSIDPRIVSPTGSSTGRLCPSGYFACYGTTLPCGQRFITPNATTNGPSSFGAYPWQAYLRNTTNNYAGSGVLLDSFHVLTAAHKVYRNVLAPTAVTVLMGVWNPSNLVNIQSSTVANIIIHESFNASTLRNDIAILTLTQPIVLGIYANINTACLPTTGTSYVGQTCSVSGWGQTSFTTIDAPTSPQKQVFVSITDYNTCRTSYSRSNLLGNNVDVYLDSAGEICAGGVNMIDACTQDGGSPLVCPSTAGPYGIAGLVIWGKNCGQPGVYGVYVNVPYYSAWIQARINTTNSAG